MFPSLARFTDLGILLLRLMVGLVFVTSGYSHLKDPAERAKSIGINKAFTIVLGIGEVSGGLGVAAGVLTQLAAIGLILIMLGAIGKKSSRGTLDSGGRRRRAGIMTLYSSS